MIKIKQPQVGAIKDYHTILPNGLITQNGVSDEIVGTQLIQRFHYFKVSDIVNYDTFDPQTDPETAQLLEDDLVPYCQWLGTQDPSFCFLYILFPPGFIPKPIGESLADLANLVTTVYDYVLPSVLNSVIEQYEDEHEAINQLKVYLTEYGAYGFVNEVGTIYAYLPAFESCSSAQEALNLLDPNSTFTYELETPIIHNLASGGNPYMDFNVVEGGTYEALPTNTPTVETMNADVVFNIDGEDVDGSLGNKTVVTGDEGTWKLKKIFGNTVAWNQLVKNGNFINSSFWRATNNASMSVSDGVCTIVSQASGLGLRQDLVTPTTEGHKYIVKVTAKGQNDGDVLRITIQSTGIVKEVSISNAFEDYYVYGSTTLVKNILELSPNATTIYVKNVVIFDLTLIYGAGNEPSTPEQFEADYQRWFGKPLTYEKYDEGSLRSVQLDAIKTVGFNQWDEEWENGYYANDGFHYNADIVCSKNFIKVEPNTNYYIKSPRDVSLHLYDSNKNYIKNLANIINRTFNTENACFLNLNSYYSQHITTYSHDICINISDPSKNGTYVPYSTSSLPLTITTLQGTKSNGTHEVMFPDGLKKAGNVYDEIDYSTGKAIKRIGSINLGSLGWSIAQTSRFYAILSNLPYIGDNTKGNLLCQKYITRTRSELLNYDKSICGSVGAGISYVNIYDTQYTAVSDFTSAMNGVMLYYELAKPIEYTIDGFIQEPKRIIANKLSEGYTELEYLESTGTQYIDTGYKPNDNTSIDIKFSTISSQHFVFGSRKGTDGNDQRRFCLYVSQYNKFNPQYGNTNYPDVGSFNVSTVYQVQMNKNGLVVDGVTIKDFTSENFTGENNLILFGNNTNGTVVSTENKIYYFEIDDNGTLVQNLIPCRRNSDNVLGMYDTVTGTFFTNAGTGEFIAGPDKNEVKMVYAGQTPVWYAYYGWDYNTSTLTVTRIGNTTWHKELPIQSKMRRCAVKDDGTVKYISSWDYTKYEDGNTVDYAGGDGQIMVEIPEYYYEAYEETVDGVVHKILKLYPYAQIGQKSKKFYCGAFEGITDDASSNTPKLYSISTLTGGTKDGSGNYLAANWTYTTNAADYGGSGGTNDSGIKSNWSRPRTSLSITDFRNRATNRGAGWSQLYFTAYNSILRLYTVEYCNFNSQATFNSTLTAAGYHQGGLGAGVTNANSSAWSSFNSSNPFIPCGVTKELGSNTGIIGVTYASGEFASAAYTTYVPSYRGIENPFGHIWKWTDGYTKYGESSTATVYTCDDITKFSDSVTNQNVPDGYSAKGTHSIGEGNFGDWYWNSDGTFVHKTFGTGPFSDYAYHNNTGTRALRSGGDAGGAGAGLFCWATLFAPSYVRAYIGGRLYYTPLEN